MSKGPNKKLRIYKEGQRFGRLTITEAYVERTGWRWHHAVLCDCGNVKMVAGSNLRSRHTSSCGCLQRDLVETHKMAYSREYSSWHAMLQRCNNKKDAAYKNYGGRGITVCKEWLSFIGFIEDMGIKASADLTLERVDNEKGYSPDNCIWADWFTQAQNRRIGSNNKTGRAGVSINSRKKTYTATITRNKKTVFLGNFSKLDDAIAARVKAEETFNQTGEILSCQNMG